MIIMATALIPAWFRLLLPRLYRVLRLWCIIIMRRLLFRRLLSFDLYPFRRLSSDLYPFRRLSSITPHPSSSCMSQFMRP